MFIAFCYFPPEGSVFYTRNDVDLYQSLEESIFKYKQIGDVYIAGDFNSRCGDKDDFILHDNMSSSLLDRLEPLIYYENDDIIKKRNSMDITVNNFGRKFLDLCKTCGVRIVNGRHDGDLTGSITFYSAKGMSLIDYLLVQKNKLSNIVKFASGDFNTFSDHSPLSFSISISISQEKNTENNTEQKNVRACSTSVKWIEENASAINDVINENVDNLFDCIDSRCDTLDDINHCIHKFSTTLSDLVLPHCKVYHGTMNTGDKVNKPIKQHRPWFTDECKTRYSDYKLALCNFNKCKSSENRRILNEKKLLYKKFIRKKKRQYERHEGNMLSKLRKDNPKVFYKHFAKKKNNANSNISIDDFHEYFKKLVCSEVNENNDNDYSSMDGNDSIYEQLDVQISEKEIINAIAKLKRDKSCAEDGLINEIFINSKITLVPVLCKLFNLIFDTGIFPEAWSSGCIVPIYKKGNVNEPTNYRGITIISCLGKLFTSVLCNRILDWDREYNLITDAQFGFKPGHSTVDAIFVLQSLINRTLKKKGRLYCCFVDYKKAFDYVNRSSLWDKLIKLGIRERIRRLPVLVKSDEGPLAFYAFLSSDEVNPSRHHTLVFDYVKTNTASAYNKFTGAFTVPSQGLYVFTTTVYVQGFMPIDIIVNNDAVTTIYPDSGRLGPWISATGIAVVNVNVGDIVLVRTRSDHSPVGTIKSSKVVGLSSFSGWMIA
ncbi:hypothetical protein FSP39_017010 [Pinctada imbricata]|uniref:C1q domain-containing protein n=1 Tax=Pinctada imbricata TaxID=66713 RepID=A0AA88XL67_PINIB|nr:hypothetical protein FSP39_017010 [Pinctada imbricata]